MAILEYRTAMAHLPRASNDSGLLITSAVVATVIGLAILAALADLLIVNWPSFGLILIAVPIGLVALAFLSIAVTAARFAKTN